jgi:23S rRNA pseudouridine2605 synthase
VRRITAQQEGNTLSNLNIPSAEQLADLRLKQWHQNGEALLTFENLRSWINAVGIALFAPRAAQLPAPAPSMVEAVLGAANAAPSLADTEQARILLARLIAEGAAVPLNLLGSPTGTGGDTPDFVVSTAVFPYIFTLRGDKAWKQPPSTSGPIKVSPLALNTYTLLTERITMSAYDLATQLGKEVTETAVLRALNELWSHLRVLPIPQPDGAATLWELTSTRFTKQMKAGANAGQPSALSALTSLYLGQAIVATEEEIETFLSPLAARSRIRDVVHALMAARQLETIAIDGRTVLHVNGDLPAFNAPAPAEATTAEPTEATGEEGTEPRIKKFIATPRKIGTGYVRKPFAPSASPRERRPFTRESNRPDRPSFTKPWAEEQADRLAAAQNQPTSSDSTPQETPRTYTKPSYDRQDKRPSYGNKPSYGSRPSFGDKPRYDSDRGRPSFSRDNDSRPPRREFSPRPTGDSGDFAPRKTFSKPGTFGRKREGGFAGKPSFGRDNDSRPPRRDFGDSRPPRREFTPRTGGEGFGGPPSDRGFRKPFTPREGGAGPSRFGGKPSYPPREGSGESPAPRFRKFDAPRGDRPSRPYSSDRPARPEGSGYAGKPSFGAKKPYGKPEGGYAGKSGGSYAGKSSGYAGKSTGYKGKSSGGYAGNSGKPASTFDKFKDNKKPFGKRTPTRKYKPEDNKSAE